MSKFNIGDKVRFIDGDLHENISKHYPKINTVGIIKLIGVNGNNYLVQWPEGSTSQNDLWWVAYDRIELVKDKEMTNKEIWEMLLPKMRKNGLEIAGYLQDYTGEVGCYDEDDVHNAIALSYRSGYERAMKGCPFKFGEKKKKGGHWEPVDTNNLPKEGTRVRYSRECKKYKAYNNTLVILGDLGKVDITPEGWFGIRLDNPRSSYSWLSFHDDGIASCLDMWVEDDE